MAAETYKEVLELARRLPEQIQHRLAQDLLQPATDLSIDNADETNLRPLIGFTEEELKTLAHSVVAPQQQKRIQTILDSKRDQTATAQDNMELDRLLLETERVALLKTRALYTLQLKQIEISL